MKWIVDDRGRVAPYNSHPTALWAGGTNPPLRAILDLGFIYIEELPKVLTIGLNPPRVKIVTLVGAFYFIADHHAKPVAILSGRDTGPTQQIIVIDSNDVYQILEEMVRSAHDEIPSVATAPTNETGAQENFRGSPELLPGDMSDLMAD